MREILFRGKNIYGGQWGEGNLLIFPSGRTKIVKWNNADLDFDQIEVVPETVGQFTGLTDKNGKKIFEGDICRFREWSKGDMCWIGKVHYEHQQFVISGEKNKECDSPFLLVMSRFIPKNIEIIGNIHDNPELLNN